MVSITKPIQRGELAQNIGSQAVQRRRSKEENDGGLHGLDVHRTGIAGDGNCSNQSGVADNGADGVTISHCTGTSQCAGGGNHDFRQRGTDGNDSCTNNDVGQIEALGNTGSAINKPVAALDQQHQTNSKKQDGCNHILYFSFC